MSQPDQTTTPETLCPRHTGNHIEWTCSAGSCPYRALCNDCITEHTTYYPHHSDQTSTLSDWPKQYLKLAKNLDPRESHQLIYHIEEVGMVLRREKYELEKTSKALEDSFEGVLCALLGRLKSLKEFLHESLWRDFNKVSEEYNNLIQEFSALQKFNANEQIAKAMEDDLQKYLAEQNLREYFDRVYSGHYDEAVYNSKLNSREMITELKKKRKQLEDGFKTFDAQEFEKKWTQELNQFIVSIESTCDDAYIFKDTKLDFINSKSPKLIPAGKSPHSSYITCLSSLEGLSTSFMARIDSSLFMTVSEQRKISLLDSNQNFSILKDFSLSEDLVSSVELLNLDPPANCPPNVAPTAVIAVIGGNDDYPALEVWDCLRNKNLACLENVHDYGISYLKLLKKESFDLKETFFVASGSSDGFIKLWQIDVVKPEAGEYYNYKVKVDLVIKISAHDSFISTIVSLPSNEQAPSNMLLSCSQDKSLFLWSWEAELNDRLENQASSPDIKMKGKKVVVGANDANQYEKYRRRIPDAHTDRINDLILLNDKQDFSDFEHYATGGAEGLIKVWNFETGELVKTFSNSFNSPVASMEYLKKDRIACTANEVYLKHFYVGVWNWKTASLVLNIRDHQARVCKVSWLGEGMFMTCDKNKTIKLWQLEEENKLGNTECQLLDDVGLLQLESL